MKYCLITLLALATLNQAVAEWVPGNFNELGVLPNHAVAWEREVTQGDRTVRVTGVSFQDRNGVFRVIENDPAARKSLAMALRDNEAVAGVNGGYFHPDFTPLGLVISGGKTLHSFERAKLLSGILAVRDSRIELVRSGAFKPGADVREALQAGPWLVEDGAVIPGLNTVRLARRTVVAGDGKGNWALVTTTPATLAETADLLATRNLAGTWTVRNALNLDGGSSTMFLALTDSKAVIDIPSYGPVRNYLAIIPRRR